MKNFELIDDGSGNLLVKSTEPEIARKENDGWIYKIRSDSGQIEEAQTDKLFRSLERAFGWEKKVLDGQVKSMFWQDNTVDLILQEKMGGAMANNFNIKKNFALRSSEESVAAAIFHELVEMWREEIGLVGEGAPLLAEFLFCGTDRGFFKELSDHYGESRDSSHQRGWNIIINDFGFDKDSDRSLFEDLSLWKNSMTEAQKLSFVRDKLIDWRQE